MCCNCGLPTTSEEIGKANDLYFDELGKAMERAGLDIGEKLP